MIRPIALILTVLTGLSGLVYQVAWQKYLAILLGSHSEAVAAVLAIFLGGLALGYEVFGRVTKRFVERARARGEAPRLLRLYAAVESGIGVYALLFPVLFSLTQWFSTLVPHVGEAFNFLFDVFLTVLLLAPPTVLMGGTIPVLTQALSAHLSEATRVHAWIYSFNTAGAFFGALLGAFVLIPQLGLDGVMLAMGGVNLFAGATFFVLGRRARFAPPGAEEVETGRAPERFAGYAAVVLLSGFAMMCIQTTLNRVGALALGASHFTFAMVVAVFVLCIALGSFAVSALSRIPPLLIVASQWLLVALLALLYFEFENAPYYAHVLRVLFTNLPPGLYPYHFMVFVAIFACLFVPIGLSGALLPLVFHHLRNELGGLGGVAGRLYAWNTFGSLLGALLGGYALLFFVDLQHVFAIALAALAVGASLLSVLVLRLPVYAAALASVAVMSACFALPDWEPFRMSAGLFRQRTPTPQTFLGADALFEARQAGTRVLFHDDDPTHTVMVTAGNSLAIVANGKPDGNLRYDYTTMAMAALVPTLLADDPRRAFVIGWGMGVTSGVLGNLDGMQEVITAEISPAVLEAAPFFDAGTHDATRNPRVSTIRSDAYRALLRSEGQFDVIASEPSNPWVMGVEMLYSKEFLSVVRDRLTPGGVYAQWFHLYEVDQATLDIVIRTFKAVFGDMSIWYTRGADVMLLGFKDPARALDPVRLRERFERPDFRREFALAGVPSWRRLLAHEVLPFGMVGATELKGEIHTLRHPILSDSAARAFFAGEIVSLPRMPSAAAAEAGARHSLLAHELGGEPPSEDVLADLVAQACEMSRPSECGLMLAYWKANFPKSARMERALRETRYAGPTLELTHELPGATIDALAQLYRGRALVDVEAPGPVRNAIVTSFLYASYFNPVFPFDRAVLVRTWSDCASEPETAIGCAHARRNAEELLGPIFPKTADAKASAAGVAESAAAR